MRKYLNCHVYFTALKSLQVHKRLLWSQGKRHAEYSTEYMPSLWTQVPLVQYVQRQEAFAIWHACGQEKYREATQVDSGG